MVMIFQSKVALKQLLEQNWVETFRVKRRKRIGKDWATDRRGGRKIANIVIEEEQWIDITELEKYLSLSGFDTVENWKREIIRLNGVLPANGWMYLVRKVKN